MGLSDHQPVTLDKFYGLWRNGDPESTPLDHFQDCNNVQSQGINSFKTRYGIEISQDIVAPLGDIVRIYNYITQDAQDLLALTTDGKLWHITNALQTVVGPILDIAAMTDFSFVAIAGRAFISPFTSYGNTPNFFEKGLQNEFLYVYLGDGSAARKAAGTPPVNGAPAFAISNGSGLTDAGVHLFGVVYEFDTGFLTAPSCFTPFTTSAANGVTFDNIPVSPSGDVVSRRLVATKVIPSYNGDTTGYQYFFIPDGRIGDNTTDHLDDITFFDADLLEDASHLIDNFSEIPAGANLGIYHGRLLVSCTFDDISLTYVSTQGEPEAISQIDGILISPLDGNPITNTQEMRDVLYVCKRNRTNSFVDNGDVPSSWPLVIIDQAIGCPVHGIATVLDSGGTTVDFLILASYKGVVLFNGRFFDPELSYKIKDYWLELERAEFRKIQIVNDAIHEIIYIVLPNGLLLAGDYANGMDPKKIRWYPNEFDINVNTVALINTDTLIIGSEGRLEL